MTDISLQISAEDLFLRAQNKRTHALLSLTVLAIFVALMSILIGPTKISLSDIGHGLLASTGLSDSPLTGDAAIVSAIRLPRTILGICVGAALGISGAALQGLFRNPLVDPQLIGVSSGGALGAALWIITGSSLAFIPSGLSVFMTAIFAFTGSLIAMFTVYKIGARHGHVSVATMLLAGIAVNALAAAGLGLLLFMSDDFQLRAINFWMMGSIGGAMWSKIWPAIIVTLCVSVILLRDADRLNLFAIGENEARHLGCDVKRLKRRLVILPALATAAAVSVSGIIGFIGLVAPHLVRLIMGSDHKLVLPGSALLGVILILFADILARLLAAPAELPLGVVTSFIGAPFFIWLLSRQKVWSL